MAHANPIEIEKCLKGMNYPAKKNDLIKHAQQQGANPDVIETLKELRDANFNSPVDVNKAISEIDRQQRQKQQALGPSIRIDTCNLNGEYHSGYSPFCKQVKD